MGLPCQVAQQMAARGRVHRDGVVAGLEGDAAQVRQPLYRHARDHWRHYEPWLGPLKAALGPVLDHYPAVPAEGELPV